MKLRKLGRNISEIEILDITQHGIWIYVQDKEYFLSYQRYPWFQNARITEICNVQLLHDRHLYWSDLDVDLDVETLANPEKYPLIYHS